MENQTNREQPVIRELGPAEPLEESAVLIRAAFGTVAAELRLTPANCPTNPAFLDRSDLEALRQKGVKLYALRKEGRSIGFVALEKADPELYYLEKLAVHPDYRHCGYGRQLLDFAFRTVRAAGGRRVSIAIIDENARLKRWYQAYGFRETGLKNFPHLPFTVCFLQKEVAT
ncbi:acetyltransferase (GNAT) family protein [Hydrogenispora ethanolica]|uniref:Acetyltransferase (GNAT) family protein n=1 Tax=Hydrogenispora ethanolica TaxID=1082276 RepID=A0A4V2QGM0_HYDET|nr:GNAT family N-acetyltransferase [Hydrogenispora ethanolica]TCL76387.1 acetyltransferase (GNAT) family protein [Hydrogenispora ethanolica]